MAVIIQKIVGAPDADNRYFYPTLAGVANSVDFYPQPHTSSQHGCAQLGLGLGVSVVENTPAVHFSLSDPRTLLGPSGELPVTALDLTATPGSVRARGLQLHSLLLRLCQTSVAQPLLLRL